MGAALYIVLEKQVPGLDTMVDGKMLSQAEKRLADLAERLGVRPLMEFFSLSPDEASGFLQGEGIEDVAIPAEQWFSAEEGLKTVTALLQPIEQADELRKCRKDLEEFERVLRGAHKLGIRWHLAVDF